MLRAPSHLRILPTAQAPRRTRACLSSICCSTDGSGLMDAAADVRCECYGTVCEVLQHDESAVSFDEAFCGHYENFMNVTLQNDLAARTTAIVSRRASLPWSNDLDRKRCELKPRPRAGVIFGESPLEGGWPSGLRHLHYRALEDGCREEVYHAHTVGAFKAGNTIRGYGKARGRSPGKLRTARLFRDERNGEKSFSTYQHLFQVAKEPSDRRKYLIVEGYLVDLTGIEPVTSSMPWKRAPSCATGPLPLG
jgi:hypothetical protein